MPHMRKFSSLGAIRANGLAFRNEKNWTTINIVPKGGIKSHKQHLYKRKSFSARSPKHIEQLKKFKESHLIPSQRK